MKAIELSRKELKDLSVLLNHSDNNCYDSIREKVNSVLVPDVKTTELGKSYWDESGAYQKEYKELYDKLVPPSGSSETLHGELIRAISRLFYDYCNNGNCNAAEAEYGETEYACDTCGGSGEIEVYGEQDSFECCEDCGGSGVITEEEIESVTITSFYQEFIDLIQENLVKEFDRGEVYEIISAVERIIADSVEEHGGNYFNRENMAAYNKLSDYVIWFVLNTDDAELPENYERG